MFAVIKTGGKQYKVSKDDIVSVEKLLGKPGDQLEIKDVLWLGETGKAPTIGTPFVEKASVTVEILNQDKGEKVIIFKKKRRHNYRRKRGHRQELTLLKVLQVNRTSTKAKVPSKKIAAEKSTSDLKTTSKKVPAKGTKDNKVENVTAGKKTSAKSAVPKKAKSTEKKPPAKKAPTKKTSTKKPSTSTRKSTKADKD